VGLVKVKPEVRSLLLLNPLLGGVGVGLVKVKPEVRRRRRRNPIATVKSVERDAKKHQPRSGLNNQSGLNKKSGDEFVSSKNKN
jgi:hypothetical protein